MAFDSDEYRFLSNFWPCKIILDAEVYSSVEHAYQAAKTIDPFARALIRGTPTPAAAKRLGRNVLLRPEWTTSMLRVNVMRDLLRQKFSIQPLRERLLATGDVELIEGNHWGDHFWGVCDGRGENHLGKLLMEIRGEVRTCL